MEYLRIGSAIYSAYSIYKYFRCKEIKNELENAIAGRRASYKRIKGYSWGIFPIYETVDASVAYNVHLNITQLITSIITGILVFLYPLLLVAVNKDINPELEKNIQMYVIYAFIIINGFLFFMYGPMTIRCEKKISHEKSVNYFITSVTLIEEGREEVYTIPSILPQFLYSFFLPSLPRNPQNLLQSD